MKRIRLGTLMIWVAIAGLSVGIIVLEVRHAETERRLMARHRAELAECQAKIKILQDAIDLRIAEAERSKTP